MPKRPADDVETAIQAAGINDDDWMQKLLEVDKEELILIVSQIVNEGNIDNRSIKKARIELPSFSTAKWIDFARRADLPEDPEYLGLEQFNTPVYQLPPSFHKAIFENSWRAQDVYREVVDQSREESRVRVLDAVRIQNDSEVHFWTLTLIGSILFRFCPSFMAESLTSLSRPCRAAHSQPVAKLNTK